MFFFFFLWLRSWLRKDLTFRVGVILRINQLDYWILENPTNPKLEKRVWGVCVCGGGGGGGGVYSLDYLPVGPCFVGRFN